MEEKKNIFQKLQRCRVELQARKLKQTGKNTYSNYTYYELGDFLPAANEIAEKNGLCPIFAFNKEVATLTIFDTDNPEKTIVFSTPVDIPNLKGCSVIQNIGGAQTFARRYLYIMAFEVSEADTVNNGVDPQEEMMKRPISTVKKVIINKLIDDTKTDVNKFLAVVGFKRVEDITEGAFPECKKMLEDKKEELIKREAKRKADEIKRNQELGDVF